MHNIVDCFIAFKQRAVFHCLMNETKCGWKRELGQDITCLQIIRQFESLPNPKSQLALVKTCLTGPKLLEIYMSSNFGPVRHVFREH